MNDRKPYLLQALYNWIVDNDCTPHLIVAQPGAGWVSGVPDHLLQEEILVLNISPRATQNLYIDNDACYFETRFQGKACAVSVAMPAIYSIVARENGEGMQFNVPDDLADGPTMQQPAPATEAPPSTSHLKILK